MKCIRLSDFLLQQVNAFFIRGLFEKAFETFLWLLRPVNQTPLLLMNSPFCCPAFLGVFLYCCCVYSFPGVFLGLPLHSDI